MDDSCLKRLRDAANGERFLDTESCENGGSEKSEDSRCFVACLGKALKLNKAGTEQ